MSERFLRLPQVRERTGLSRSSIYTAIARGEFPANVKLLGARASGWPESAIDKFIAERIAASRAA